MIKYTTGFVDKLEDILEESKYTVRYERGNFQSGWCLLDHKRVVVLNKFLNTEGRVNTLVELIPQLKIDYDMLTLNSQKLFDFLTKSRLEKLGMDGSNDEASEEKTDKPAQDATEQLKENEHEKESSSEPPTEEQQRFESDLNEKEPGDSGADSASATDGDAQSKTEGDTALENQEEPTK